MKIAVWHNLPSGGGKRALYNHVKGLTERGHKLECWSLETADHTYLPLSEFAPEHIIKPEPAKQSLKLTSKLAPQFNEAIHRMQEFDAACNQCAREIAAGDFDLLFANSAIHYATPYILRHLKMKKVLYLQEPCRFLYEAAPMLPWISRAPSELYDAELFQLMRFLPDFPELQTLRLQAKQEWLNAQACDLILVNSYFSRESVLRAYGVSATVCYLGVDTALFRDRNLPRENFVIGVGSFDPIKRIELAIEAVALLPEPRRLVWIGNAGKEDYLANLRELAQIRGVSLELKLNVTDSELVTLLNRASLMLCTSRLEPFGFGVLEANACGLPVVAVKEGGFRETVQHGSNGFLAEVEAKSIATAATQIIESPVLAKQMSETALSMVQQDWNVEASVDRLESILLQVV
ncbi:MAG TPA: glycosyltransferase family 4 protein [Pyrinomonadaceae bacterium]